MSKATITRCFAVAIVAVVAGLVLATAAVAVALADGAVVVGGPQVVTLNGAAFAGAVAALVVAGLAIAAGGFAAIASWIGALVNTSRMDDKTWFVALLVLGLLSFGWLAMIAYVVLGPDGTAERRAADGAVPSQG